MHIFNMSVTSVLSFKSIAENSGTLKLITQPSHHFEKVLMIIPNISKFGKAVILSKIDFPFVYKAHAQHDFFYTSKPEVTGLSLFSIVIPSSQPPTL